MSDTSLLCNPFCDPGMLKELEQSRVMEIAPDVWLLEGHAGTMFFTSPPTCNIFIMRDGDMVLMVDSGHHAFYRDRILSILRRFVQEGAKELILMVSHGHWDHGKNNDIIYEAGYERVRFLLPEPEFHTINIPDHMIANFHKAREYYDPLVMIPDGLRFYAEWAKAFPEYNDPKYQETWKIIESLPAEYDYDSAFAAWESVLTNVLCPDLSTYVIDKAEMLSLESRETRRYGDVEFQGWPVGRFFAIHDASQSPGHICIYDPLNKLMITGDATLEINPPFFDCGFNACIEICQKCLRMSEQGDIVMATDAHRTSQWWIRLFTAWGVEPLDPLQLVDAARGRDECTSFYKMWVDYFSSLREETLQAHSRIGEATVPEIVEELRRSTNKYVVFKLGLSMPYIPSVPELLVAKVLAEGGASRRVEGDRILFRPIEKWSFSNV